jgi:MFS family permease
MPPPGTAPDHGPDPGPERRKSPWVLMTVAVTVEFAVGLAALVLVPLDRPSGAFPQQGRLVYDLHGALGFVVLVGAVALVVTSRQGRRLYRNAAVAGLVGIVVGGAGGLLAADHPLRVAGVALMFVGALVAGFAYLVGILEPEPQPMAAASPDAGESLGT